MASLNIRSVTFEHHPNGFGVGHREPRISWSFEGSEAVKGWLQESYDIQIGQSDSDEGTTHHVESSQSVLVPWPSNALHSRKSAWVKVRAHGKSTDADGNRTVALSTDWSEAAVVEAALLDKQDWTAKLTSAEAKPDASTPIRPTLFRRTFTLPTSTSKVAKARLYITAHGVYKVYLNGQLIGSDEMAPGWTSYKHRLPYQIHDVEAALKTDAPNVLGVEVAEGWFAGKLGWEGHGRIYGDRLAFLAQLEVAFQDGQNFKLESDSKWKCSPSPITRSEIYDGEEYDSREEQIGWTSDANLDESGWTSTEELEFPSAELVASVSPQVRVLEEIRPIKIFKSKSGKALIDFGQNLVGKLQVKLPAASSEAHKLTFRHAEVLEHDELGTRPLREAKATDVVILSPSQPELWSPKFTFHGFRYVQVDGWPTPDGLPTTENLTALVMHSDMARTGWFSCSEPLVNQLHENAVWSLKGNFFSIPTDCPQRDERLGWTGDIQVFTPSAAFLYNVNGFLHSWLADVAVEQLQPEARGIPGLVVPNILDNPNPPGPQCAWHDVTVLTPWDLFNSSGDAALLRKQYASMKAWVDQGLPRGENGLWDQNVWQYGDWLDPSAPPDQPGNGSTDSHLIADAYLVRVLDTIAKVSAMLGEAADALKYAQDAAKTRKTFQDEYITASGLVVGDTATAYSLAIMFGLTDRVEKAGKRLSHVVHRSEYRISTGFVGTTQDKCELTMWRCQEWSL